jgi:phage repressor protein C with HTH and peptisase S24 domain
MSNKIEETLDIIQYKTKKNLDEIAKDIGITRPYLSSVKKKGEPIDILNRLISYYQNDIRGLEVSSEDLNSYVGEPLHKVNYQQERFSKKNADKPDIPVFTGNTRAGTIEIYTDDPSQQTPIGHLSAKVFPGCNHAEKVNGDSMYPLICNQAYVVGKIIDKNGIIWGEKYVIHTVHGQSVVKFIHPSKKANCIKIVSHNKSIPEQDIPLDDITFCCRVHFIVNPS